MGRTTILMLLACVAMACAPRHRQPDVTGAQRAMAHELIARGDYASAFAAIDPVCRQHPQDAEALALRGVIYREQGLHAEARADLEESAHLDADRAATHAALAVLYDTIGDGDRALEQHRKASELDPRNPSYLNNLGFSLFVQGKPREAIPVLTEALRGAPTDTRIRNNLAFSYAAVGELSRAAEHFERGGRPAEARNNLGYAYERRGNMAQAFALYSEAVRLDPASQVARQNLTRLALKLNRAMPAAFSNPPAP